MKDEKNFLIVYFAATYVLFFAVILPGFDWLDDADSDVKVLYGAVVWLIVLAIFVVLIVKSKDMEFLTAAYKIWRFYAISAVFMIVWLILMNLILIDLMDVFPLGVACFKYFVAATPYGVLPGLDYLTQPHLTCNFVAIPSVANIIISISVFLLCRFKKAAVSAAD